MNEESYRVEDFETGLRNLTSLVDVIAQLHCEQTDNARDQRVDSLIWIARELAIGVETKFLSRGEVAA